MYKQLLVFTFLWVCFFIAGCVKKETGNPFDKHIKKEKAIEDLQTLSEILQKVHPSLYLYTSKKRLDFITDSIRNTFTDDVAVGDLFNNFSFLVNEIGCSHTSVTYGQYVYDTLQSREYFFPYSVKLIDGKLLVNNRDYELTEGTEIKEVNGQPALALLQTFALYNTIDGKKRKGQEQLAAEDFGLFYFYKYGPKKVFSLIIKDTSGATKEIIESSISLKEWHNRNSDYKYYFDEMGADYDLYFINNDECAIIRLPTFSFKTQARQQAFENFCNNTFDLLSKKKEVKKLVIDLRENTGGDLYNCFLLYSYLAPKPFAEYEKVVAKMAKVPKPELLDEEYAEKENEINEKLKKDFTASTTPGYYVYADTLIDTWEPQSKRFTGQVYVVTNSRVTSSASYFSQLVKNSHAGKIVGEETAGSASTGNGFSVLEYVMPNSEIKLLLPYAHMIYTLKDVNTGQGVMPDYYIPDNFEWFIRNKDRQISFITDSLNKK